MAPKNASKARSTGPETPLRRSTRGKLGETAHVQETIDTKSSARKGKQSTVADPINSPQKILHQRGRSKKQEGTVGLRQSQVLEESVQAGSNLGEGVGTRSARGAAEQERLLLESALYANKGLKRLISQECLVLKLTALNLSSAQFDDDGTFGPTLISMDRSREPEMLEGRRIWETQAGPLKSKEVYNPISSVWFALRNLAKYFWLVKFNKISIAIVLLVVWSILWPAILTAWRSRHVDIDLAIDSTCDRAYVSAFCRESCRLDWISTTFPISCSGPRSDSLYSSKKVLFSKSGPTIFERIEGHKESCKRYEDVLFPSIKDDLESTTAYKVRLLDQYKKLCQSLDHIPGELMSYYLQAMGKATSIYRYARDAQNYTQENMAYLSPPELKLETKVMQNYFSKAIPREGDMITSLKRERGRIQWQFEKLSFDFGNLKRDLKDIRAQTLEAKSTAIAKLKLRGRIDVQTDNEPPEVQRYTKAIEGLDEWYTETNALELLLMHIDLDVESLQKLVNGFVEKRLSIQAGELFGKAELQEMQPLLTWIREDARRIHEVARRSKVMRGWKQRPESGRITESLKNSEYESGTGGRMAPWS